MRVTNSMIMNNSKTDINGTKVNVDSTTHKMTTGKKIARPSDDPVIAIRSLRYATSMNHMDQYLNKNIEDADSWLDITETALGNIYTSVNNMHTLADQGANGTNTASDLSTILTSLEKLQQSVYYEGNADYAGRTIFTGYRTNCSLTFLEDDKDLTYSIQEPLTYKAMEQMRYYNGDVNIPRDPADITAGTLNPDDYETSEKIFNKIRISYKGTDDIATGDVKIIPTTDTKSGVAAGTPIEPVITSYETLEDWEAASGGTGKEVADDEMVYIKQTGEFIVGNTLADEISTGHANLEVNYTKTGFLNGELRPEYYFNCTINPGAGEPDEIYFEKYELDDAGELKYNDDNEPVRIQYDIDYIVANNQTMTVNTEACEVFDNNIKRDMDDMIDAVKWALECGEKVSKIESMMGEAQYASEDSQENLKVLLSAAKKQETYARDNLQKLFEAEISKSSDYLVQINLATTNVGNKGESLALTKTRVCSQFETIEELKSTNEDVDLSSAMLDYSAAYVSYQAALTAASKIGQQSLLNYI